MLKDTKTIVGKLEHLLGICLQLLFIFIYLAIFNVRYKPAPCTAITVFIRLCIYSALHSQVSLTRIWLTVSSLLLSFVFVFGNSIRAIYESVVYLFVVRPFDVGDAILLGPAQDWCTVCTCDLNFSLQCSMLMYMLKGLCIFGIIRRLTRSLCSTLCL